MMRETRFVAVLLGAGLGAVVAGSPAADAQPSTDEPAPVADASVSTSSAAPAADDAAGPRPRTIDVGAFVGVHAFGDDIELGNSWAAEQIPGTGVVLGVRGGATLLPDLAPASAIDPQVGVEAEAEITLASTGDSVDGGRRSYFAPVFGWRAHLIGRLRTTTAVHPHLVIGLGGETVVSSSPFMGDDTDAAFHWGGGLTWKASPAWIARADLRHGITAGRASDRVSTFELMVGVERSFAFGGGAVERVPPPPPDTDGDGFIDPEDACPTQPEVVNGFEDDDGCPDVADRDGDGIYDDVDQCPDVPEDADGFEDNDGCPDDDNDGDGVPDARDACPVVPEDLDQFQDDDGCPDLDDDADGIPDATDACPRQPEVYNGFQDGDGCPDELPKVIKEYTGVIKGITFAYSSALIQKGSKTVLNKAAAVLREYPDLRVRIEGHTDPKGIYEKNKSLSLRRAEAVKWYLVDQGIAADRIETDGLGPDKPIADNKTAAGRAKNRRIEFHLIVDAPGPAPATQPAVPDATVEPTAKAP